MARISVGDKVLLQMGIDAKRHSVPGLLRWNGLAFYVSKMKCIDLHRGFVYYELKGCNSRHGIPYSILEDWMVKL